MSTIVLDYPNSLPLRRSFSIRWIIILIAGLVLVASVILVTVSTPAKVHPSSGVITVPIPVAPVAEVQIVSSATTTPAPNPVVIAVPVATPPSQ